MWMTRAALLTANNLNCFENMRRSLFLIVSLLLFFTSCNTELKLAKRFVEENQQIPVAVLFPETAEVKLEYNHQYGQTSVLDGFSQDLFLDVIYNSYAEGLRDFGLDVYVPENLDSISIDSTHWYVLLSQMEITGRITEYEDYLFSETDNYSYKYPLNTVNVAAWFDVNNGEWLPVMFCENNLIDKFSSRKDYNAWTAKMDYDHLIDTLELGDVYDFGAYLGKQYASYTYNCLMKKFVETEMAKAYNLIPSMYVKYDPYRKKFYYDTSDDWFIEVK